MCFPKVTTFPAEHQPAQHSNSTKMLARSAVAVRRGVATSGRPMSSFLDRRDTLAETRAKHFSNPTPGAENPTYLKMPYDKYVTSLLAASVVTSVGLVLYGLNYTARK